MIQYFMTKFLSNILVVFVICSLLSSCNNEAPTVQNIEPVAPKLSKHLEKIQQRGKIVAITDYNSHGYFIYRGTPMGFQYELLNSFAAFLEVDLEIVIVNDLVKSLDYIQLEQYDLLAMDLAITADRREKMLFTHPIYQSRQVLVQKKPDGWRKMRTWDDIESHLVRDAIHLQGKTVHITKGSVFNNRLQNINF